MISAVRCKSKEGGYIRNFGLVTAIATATQADTEGALYVHSPVSGGWLE